MVKVDLITTLHNREDYLPATLQSVRAQTYQNFRYWIWDDASTDQSAEIAQDFVQARPGSTLIQSPTNVGHTAALIGALAQGQADYIGWVDSDDLLAPDCLQQCVYFLDYHPEVGLVYTQHEEIDPSGRPLGLGRRAVIPYSPDRLLVDFMVFHFRLFRRSVFEQVGGIDPTYAYAQDYELCLRLSEVTQIQRIDHPLYFYRRHPDSIGSTIASKVQQIECAKRAVESALLRRGLGDRLRLEVEVHSRFNLRSI